MHFLVISSCSCDFLLTSLYITAMVVDYYSSLIMGFLIVNYQLAFDNHREMYIIQPVLVCICTCYVCTVCMYRMYVCTYVCMHICMHACMYVCMHVCMYVITEVLHLVATVGCSFCSQYHVTLVFLAGVYNILCYYKAMPNNFINGKYHIKQLKSGKSLNFNTLGGTQTHIDTDSHRQTDTHSHTQSHTHTDV